MLQKQISNLRTSQIEYEGSKHEIRNLQEEVDVLDLQVKEQTNLKKIAEKQLEEALESLQVWILTLYFLSPFLFAWRANQCPLIWEDIFLCRSSQQLN